MDMFDLLTRRLTRLSYGIELLLDESIQSSLYELAGILALRSMVIKRSKCESGNTLRRICTMVVNLVFIPMDGEELPVHGMLVNRCVSELLDCYKMKSRVVDELERMQHREPLIDQDRWTEWLAWFYDYVMYPPREFSRRL